MTDRRALIKPEPDETKELFKARLKVALGVPDTSSGEGEAAAAADDAQQ